MAEQPTKSLPDEPNRRTRIRIPWRELLLAASTLLCLCLFYAYSMRPDGCAAVTVWPAWIWLIPGLLLVLAAMRRRNNRWQAAVTLLWLIYLLSMAEEPRSLFRFRPWPSAEWSAAHKGGRAIRVVSLNCAGGSPEAAVEAGRFHPDVILYQESPPRDQIKAAARKVFGPKAGIEVGLDASLAARGSVTPVALPPREHAYFVEARIKLDSGIEFEAISTRLTPAVLNMELWSPSCWREQAESRRNHRRQVQAIADRIHAVPLGVPIVLAGDFNAPQGDAVFRLFQPRLRDAFPEAGIGWGDTIVNDIPLLRIDQIWVSQDWRPDVEFAQKTVYSDHRMVVCDLILREPGYEGIR